MAKVLFKQGTLAQYQAITPSENTFYAVTNLDSTVDFYLGSLKLSQQTAIDILNGADTVAGSVAKQIKDAIEALDFTDTAVANQFVTAIAETDGKITVSRAALIAADIPELTLAKISDAGTAAASDVAATAIAADTTDTSLVTAEQVAKFVKDEIADLAGATHFRGVVVSLSDITDAEAGDIAIVGVKEYIYVPANGEEAAKWVELGDESIYATKTTTIAGVDLENNITKQEMLTALNVADGAQINALEGVQVNGTNLAITNKKVNVTVATGSANGTVAVNGTNVAVKGLDSAAYAKTTDFDAAGAAAAVLGTGGDTKTATTVYGAKAYALDIKTTLEGTDADTKDSLTLKGLRKYAEDQAAATKSVWETIT